MAETPRPFLSSTAYDRLKFTAQIVLPALGTLYFTIALLWGLPKSTEVIGTITAIDVFLGILLGISTRNYDKAGKDGTLVVDKSDPDTDRWSFEPGIGLDDLANKKSITLKVDSPN